MQPRQSREGSPRSTSTEPRVSVATESKQSLHNPERASRSRAPPWAAFAAGNPCRAPAGDGEAARALAQAAERGAQRRYVAIRLVPGDHEARFAGALGTPVVELEAGGAQPLATLHPELHEHFVRLHRVQQAGAGGAADVLRQTVGALRVTLPDSAFYVRQQLRGDVARFRQQMPGALTPQLEIPHQITVEENHRLGGQGTVLGCAEGQNVDARAPGDVRGMTVKERERVREARAVHVHLESATVCKTAELGDLLAPVDGAELGGLGQRQRRRLYAVNVNRTRAERRGEGPGQEFAVLAAQQRQLRAAGEKTRRAAFVGCDVCLFVAVNGAVRRTHSREAERVGGGSGRDREGAHLGAEECAEHRIEALRPWKIGRAHV